MSGFLAPLTASPEEAVPDGRFLVGTPGRLLVFFSCGRRDVGNVDCRYCGCPVEENEDGSGRWRHDPAQAADETGRAWCERAAASCTSSDPRPGRTVGPVFGPFDWVEGTYNYLRVGPNGEHLAVFDESRGDWVLLAPAGEYAGEAYSDWNVWESADNRPAAVHVDGPHDGCSPRCHGADGHLCDRPVLPG